MYVYDGDSLLAREIGSLTGILPNNVASTGPDIYIRFSSDNAGSSAGFQIAYEAIS